VYNGVPNCYNISVTLDGLHEEHICGRPLGMSVDKNGFLFVADAYYGIYKVNLNSGKQYGILRNIKNYLRLKILLLDFHSSQFRRDIPILNLQS